MSSSIVRSFRESNPFSKTKRRSTSPHNKTVRRPTETEQNILLMSKSSRRSKSVTGRYPKLRIADDMARYLRAKMVPKRLRSINTYMATLPIELQRIIYEYAGKTPNRFSMNEMKNMVELKQDVIFRKTINYHRGKFEDSIYGFLIHDQYAYNLSNFEFPQDGYQFAAHPRGSSTLYESADELREKSNCIFEFVSTKQVLFTITPRNEKYNRKEYDGIIYLKDAGMGIYGLDFFNSINSYDMIDDKLQIDGIEYIILLCQKDDL